MDSVTIRSMRAYRPLLAMTVAMAVLTVICVGGLLIDPRVLGGAPIWAKPFKFSVSLALYTATLALMVPLVRGSRAAWWARRAGDSSCQLRGTPCEIPDGRPFYR